ncbi:acyl transferase/acyl hydrolase/lysophospholipase [Flagelloscypha sp. PMI_526]|nr:acyl transferase/acyl hydrolase/lysophospholipase [Flagelloscypha sp. PMI_526]
MSAPIASSSDGIRLLSFDGGGIRSVSQALMVREMMHRIEEDHQLPSPPKVSDYFDMICGSGLGGLLAIMCGVFHMTGDQLVEEFVGLCKVVFSHDLDVEQRTTKLEQETGRLISTYISGGEERKLISQDNACKTFVCAASSHNAGHPRLFRTYRPRSNPSADCSICEAIRATTALPGLFNPITIHEKYLSETFVGGELRWNNPTDELTREAAREFNGRHVACIISIGSGHPGHLSLAEGLAELFPRIALDCERLNDDLERRFGNVPDVFWRLNVEQGLQNLASDLSNLDALVSHTYSYLQGSRTQRDIDSLLLDLVRRPGRTLAKMISGEVSSAPKLLGPRACPPPTQYFTGRHNQLEQLDGHFNSGGDECHVAVLYGMGGSGKTQIGLEFIRRNRSRFSDVYFIDSSSKLTLENDLTAIAVGSSVQPSVDDALRILRSRQDEWMLFLDNADDPAFNLRPYISLSHGNVLITTRNRELRIHAPKCSIWVDRLELKDARELLLRGLPVGDGSEQQDIAVTIVQELGCLALAITQAHAFLTKGLCSISEYLPLYTQNRRRLLEHDSAQKTDDYRYSMYTTWTISFNKLSSNAALLLELLSCMHHDAIPSWIFHDAWKVYAKQHKDAVPPVLTTLLSSLTAADLTWDILRFRTLVGELLSFSLLELDEVQHTFSLHPLVQQWARSTSQRYRDNAHATQTLLSLAIPIGDSVSDNRQMKSLVSHLRESIVPGITQHYTLLSCMQKVFWHGGLLRQCHDVCQKDLTESRQRLGAIHPYTLSSMNSLANTYSHLGQHRDALELQEQVLKLRKRILGEEHPDTLSSMNSLALTYSHLGQHRDALELKEQVLKLQKRILGEEHPHTLSSMSNLARTYSAIGQHQNALDLHESTLEMRRKILGEEHPATHKSSRAVESARRRVLRDEDQLQHESPRLAGISGTEDAKTLIVPKPKRRKRDKLKALLHMI